MKFLQVYVSHVHYYWLDLASVMVETVCADMYLCVKQYLFAGRGNSSIWIPDLMALIQYNVVPVIALQGVLHVPHRWIWGYQDTMTCRYLWNQFFLQ